MNKAWIFLRSVLLASAAPAAAFVIASSVLEHQITLKLSILNFIGAFIVSACHTVALGLPAVFVLQRIGHLSVKSLVAVGFAAGALPSAFLMAIQWVTEPSLSVACQGSLECQAALASSRAGAGALFVVLAAGTLGVLAALSFYASFRRSGLFQRAA